MLEQGDVPWQRGSIVEDPAVLALFENFSGCEGVKTSG